MLFYKSFNERIFPVILAFLKGFGMTSNIFTIEVWSTAITRNKFGMLPVKIESST